MEFKCTIDNTRSTRAGLKVTLFLEEEAELEFLKGQANFKKMPLLANIRVDEKEQRSQLNRIDEKQRNKLYILFKEIADFQGDNPEAVKVNLKYLFRKAYDIPEQFSLSNCTKEMAGDFINFTVGWCLMNSIGLNTPPREVLADDDVYFYLCNLKRVCCICGDHGEVLTGKENKKICLCEIHKAEMQKAPKEFMELHHVRTILMP